MLQPSQAAEQAVTRGAERFCDQTVRVPGWEQPMSIALTGGTRRRGSLARFDTGVRRPGALRRVAPRGIVGCGVVEATIPMSSVSESAGTMGVASESIV